MPGRESQRVERVPVAVYLEPRLADLLKRQAIRERRSISMQAALYIERGLKDPNNGKS